MHKYVDKYEWYLLLAVTKLGGYIEAMAKLKDAKKWLARTLGDEGRANSIFVKCRDQGLFTKTVRGGVAPDLVGRDFIAVLLCSLSTEASIHMTSAVEKIMKTELVWISLFDNQGKRKHSEFPQLFAPTSAKKLAAMGINAGGGEDAPPGTLEEHLEGILAAGGRFKDRFFGEDIRAAASLSIMGRSSSLTLTLHISDPIDGCEVVELKFRGTSVEDANDLIGDEALRRVSTVRSLNALSMNEFVSFAREGLGIDQSGVPLEVAT